MKKILVLVAFAAFSCSDRCEDVVAQYQAVEQTHQEKQAEASALYLQLESIPLDSVQDRALMEDELMFVLIDVAYIEIEMEAWKKQHVDCLNSFN
jgi:hypothetical protein